MRRLRELNRFRDKAWERNMGGVGDDRAGCFRLVRNGVELRCIASNDAGWDHVSVTTDLPRCPTWGEMDHVKRAFFRDDEVAMQLHVSSSDHISNHDYCLHLWRPHAAAVPLPPKAFV